MLVFKKNPEMKRKKVCKQRKSRFSIMTRLHHLLEHKADGTGAVTHGELDGTLQRHTTSSIISIV